MKLRKLAAAFSACILAACCTSCEKNNEESVSLPEIGENGVSDLISPAADSDEYELGQYYYSTNGTKLYCGDETVPVEALLALDNYFTTFQNNDFEGYKSTLYPDYAERYEKYLREVYSKEEDVDDDYSLKNSFEKRYNWFNDTIKNTLLYESDEDKEFTGEFKLTRIRAEHPTYEEGMTEEEFVKTFFDEYAEIFNMDYYEFIKNAGDRLVPFTFFVMVEAEDEKEHMIIGGGTTENPNEGAAYIVLAEKDGKYYTFG